MKRRLLLAGLLTALVTPLAVASSASLLPLLSGCGEGRFPVCQTNADCQQRDAGKLGNVCFNLRCVECHYDSDCAAGNVCNGTGTCSALDSRPREEGDGGPAETRSWDPANWNECAAGCKDHDCVGACDRRFHAK
jgi:hypothetical protein